MVRTGLWGRLAAGGFGTYLPHHLRYQNLYCLPPALPPTTCPPHMPPATTTCHLHHHPAMHTPTTTCFCTACPTLPFPHLPAYCQITCHYPCYLADCLGPPTDDMPSNTPCPYAHFIPFYSHSAASAYCIFPHSACGLPHTHSDP